MQSCPSQQWVCRIKIKNDPAFGMVIAAPNPALHLAGYTLLIRVQGASVRESMPN